MSDELLGTHVKSNIKSIGVDRWKELKKKRLMEWDCL